MRKIKNFDDLDFQPISPDSRTEKASLTFENGYGCNIYMHSDNTNKWAPYEFELTRNGNVTTSSEISPDGNIGYLEKNDIIDLIRQAQRL